MPVHRYLQAMLDNISNNTVLCFPNKKLKDLLRSGISLQIYTCFLAHSLGDRISSIWIARAQSFFSNNSFKAKRSGLFGATNKWEEKNSIKEYSIMASQRHQYMGRLRLNNADERRQENTSYSTIPSILSGLLFLTLT